MSSQRPLVKDINYIKMHTHRRELKNSINIQTCSSKKTITLLRNSELVKNQLKERMREKGLDAFDIYKPKRRDHDDSGVMLKMDQFMEMTNRADPRPGQIKRVYGVERPQSQVSHRVLKTMRDLTMDIPLQQSLSRTKFREIQLKQQVDKIKNNEEPMPNIELMYFISQKNS